jgi:Trypsin
MLCHFSLIKTQPLRTELYILALLLLMKSRFFSASLSVFITLLLSSCGSSSSDGGGQDNEGGGARGVFSCSSFKSSLKVSRGESCFDGERSVVKLTIPFKGKEEQHCSGSLLSPTKVLTAAHCVTRLPLLELPNDPSLFTAVVAEDSTRVASGAIHPLYNQDEGLYDIAVLTLTRPITGAAQLPIIASKSLNQATILGMQDSGDFHRALRRVPSFELQPLDSSLKREIES